MACAADSEADGTQRVSAPFVRRQRRREVCFGYGCPNERGEVMAYCARCRRWMSVEFVDFWRRSAWCTHCHRVTAVSLCKVPSWVFGVLIVMSIRTIYYT